MCDILYKFAELYRIDLSRLDHRYAGKAGTHAGTRIDGGTKNAHTRQTFVVVVFLVRSLSAGIIHSDTHRGSSLQAHAHYSRGVLLLSQLFTRCFVK
jgi:hypothetical protein